MRKKMKRFAKLQRTYPSPTVSISKTGCANIDSRIIFTYIKRLKAPPLRVFVDYITRVC